MSQYLFWVKPPNSIITDSIYLRPDMSSIVIPRTTEAIIIIDLWWTLTFGGATPVPERLAAWTHHSSVQLENPLPKNPNWIPNQNGKNVQPNGVNYVGWFQCMFRLWHATGLPMFCRVCEWIWKQHARMAADPARISNIYELLDVISPKCPTFGGFLK